MQWLKGLVGLLPALVGVGWIGQGIGLIPGSFMTGQLLWAAIGLGCLALGGWLVRGALRSGNASSTRSA